MVVDLGCGNGRDSIYFVHQGKTVLAVDLSQVALSELTQKKMASLETFQLNFDSLSDLTRLASKLNVYRTLHNGSFVFYSRFLLHALKEGTFTNLLKWLEKQTIKGDILAFETRCEEEGKAFFFGNHFRNFVTNQQIINELELANWEFKFDMEDWGFSVFRGENPKLGRLILERK